MPMTVVLGGSLLLAVFLAVAPGLPTQGNVAGRRPDHRLRLLLRHRVVAHHRPDRLVVEPDLGDDDRDADHHLPDLRRRWAGPATSTRRSRCRVGAIVCIAAANAGTTSQDLKTGYIVGATPIYQQIGLIIGVHHLGVRHRLDDALPAPGVRHRLGGGGGAAGDADGDDHPGPAAARTCRGGWCWSACSSRSRSSCAASTRCRSRSARTCRSRRRRRSSPAASCGGASSARPA